jgi:hypothetical protein
VNPHRRIAAAWAHILTYAEGKAEASIIETGMGWRILVIDAVLAGRKRAATLRIEPGPADLHQIATWLEHQEERASRIALSGHGLINVFMPQASAAGVS